MPAGASSSMPSWWKEAIRFFVVFCVAPRLLLRARAPRCSSLFRAGLLAQQGFRCAAQIDGAINGQKRYFMARRQDACSTAIAAAVPSLCFALLVSYRPLAFGSEFHPVLWTESLERPDACCDFW